MKETLFELLNPRKQTWVQVPHVDEAQMREVDRIAVEEFQLGILQMMENAGRNLALRALSFLGDSQSKSKPRKVLVAAGSGGNGGGGLSAVRHLHNHGVDVQFVLTRHPEQVTGPAQAQLTILKAAGILPLDEHEVEGGAISQVDLVLDAVIGYSLKGAPRGQAKRLIELINQSPAPVIALDLPSGLDATSGQPPGVCVQASQTLTLALPKPGLTNLLSGELFLGDIGIPPELYRSLGIELAPLFGGEHILPVRRAASKLQ